MTLAPVKDPAMSDLGYARKELDFYPSEPACTQALLKHVDGIILDTDVVWEPTCGTGGISSVFEDAGYQVVNSDLVDRGYPGTVAPLDFMQQTQMLGGSNVIVTNPPYGNMAEKFLRHALELTKPVEGVVAFLMRNEYDCAKTRSYLFNKPPFAKKVVLTWRPRWVPESTGAPRHNYSWSIFSWKHTGAPTIEYAAKPKP